MYLYNPCMYPGCRKMAMSSFDSNGELLEVPGYCLEHQKNKQETLERLNHYIQTHDKIVGLCAPGITVTDKDFSGKAFYGCNLQHSTFTKSYASGLRMRMCMLDFSTITDCNLINCNIQFSSFSGSKLVHALFTGSDFIHNNFNGITAYQCSFDDSDLYNTRFIKAVLINTSMANCNLKKTVFYNSMRNAVSFKLSNTREALTDREKGGLMGDIAENLDDGLERESNL